MKTYSNLWGCSTYAVLDSSDHRHTFLGLVECNDDTMEVLKNGIEIKLSDIEQDILDTFRDNDVDLNNFTHCIQVDDLYFLTWE